MHTPSNAPQPASRSAGSTSLADQIAALTEEIVTLREILANEAERREIEARVDDAMTRALAARTAVEDGGHRIDHGPRPDREVATQSAPPEPARDGAQDAGRVIMINLGQQLTDQNFKDEQTSVTLVVGHGCISILLPGRA
jgi:hypothetical protein